MVRKKNNLEHEYLFMYEFILSGYDSNTVIIKKEYINRPSNSIREIVRKCLQKYFNLYQFDIEINKIKDTEDLVLFEVKAHSLDEIEDSSKETKFKIQLSRIETEEYYKKSRLNEAILLVG